MAHVTRALVLLLLAARLWAQPILTVTGPASAPQGTVVNLTVSVSGTAGQNLAGISWSFPAGLSLGAPAIGAAAPAGLGVYCFGATGNCLVDGLSNTTPQVASDNAFTKDGVVATVPLTLTAPPGSLSIPLTNIAGASTVAAPITITAGPTYTLTVTASHCDYNGDGAINYQDVLAIIQAVVGSKKCSPVSTFTAGCSLDTAQAVIVAATGGICSL
jgi:hypothetical protein